METGIISIPLEQWLQVAKLSMVKAYNFASSGEWI